MVNSENSFLIDATFIIERTHKTFLGTPLLMVQGRDRTFTFGFAREFLRLRNTLGIRSGVLVIGKNSRLIASDKNIQDLVEFFRTLDIPCVHDPQNDVLHIAGSMTSGFSHIVTGDRRLLQLSRDRLIIILAKNRTVDEYDWMSSESIRTAIGVQPADVPTYIALTEGASLTGKQAVRLIELFGNIDSIYKDLAKVVSSNIREMLVENKVKTYHHYLESRLLANSVQVSYLTKNADLNNIDTDRNRNHLKSYAFYSLVRLLPLPNRPVVQPELTRSMPKPDSYHAVIDRAGMQELESLICSSKVCAIDTESDDKDPRKATLFGVAFSVKEGEAYFVPLIDHDLKDIVKDDVLKALKGICESDVRFVGHNLKYDYLLLMRNGLKMRSLHFDTMLAAYECHGEPDLLKLQYLVESKLGKRIKSYSQLVDKGNTLLDLPFEEMVNHGCKDADMTLRLYPIFQDELRVRELTNQFFNHSMQLLMRLGRLESEGISIDEGKLDVIRRNLLERAVALKRNVCEMLGKPFDLDSGTELTAILAQAFGLRPHFGSRIVTLSQLEQLAVSEPKVRKIVEYRRLRSQITAVDSVSAASIGGRIYPLFSQVRSPAGFVTTIRPSLFDIDGLPELGACLDSSVQDFLFDTQKSLEVLMRVTQDPLLRERTGSPEFNELLRKYCSLAAKDYDNLLLNFALGFTDSHISRAFLIDLLMVTTIRHGMMKRFCIMFDWLEKYRTDVRQNGYASYGGMRKYIDAARTADLGKRQQALDHAVRWLMQS
jgi:3'-5' exonuclease